MRGGRAARRGWLLPLVVPVLFVAVLLMPGIPSSPSAGGAAGAAVALAAGPVGSQPFDQRAGFDPALAADVLDPVSATGMRSVVVSFQPTRTGLFEPPAPGSPAMTPSDIAREYGLSPSAYLAAESYFAAHGLSVQHAWPDRLSLTLDGAASQFGSAFDTTLLSGTYHGRTVSYPASPPSLPAGLESEVAAVVGLSSGFTTFSLPFSPGGGTGPGGLAPGSSNFVTPGIARQIYGGSALYNYTGSAKYAAGQTIVLLLWGDGYAPSDLATFYSTYYPSSFPRVTITPYPIDGAPSPSATATQDPSNAPQELTLDLEWSGSLAPGANLDAVYAPDGPGPSFSPSVASMTDALNEAVTGIPGVNVISMSFGTPESSGGGLEQAWSTDLAMAMQEHITVLAATGDTGGDTATNPCSGVPQPQYPSVDPDVLAVGGTDPTLATNPLGQVTGISSESAWSGSGGGYSAQFTAPPWQLVGSAAGPISAAGHRGVPDVSAASANDFVYYEGTERTGLGTSFATPLWGGLVAEMDAQRGTALGWVNGPLYAVGAAEPQGGLPTGLVDITSGGNCLGSAGVGWDTATGWGSPRAVALYADLTASIVNVSLSASPTPAAPGSAVTLIVYVRNSTSGAPLVGVPVLVSLSADVSIGPCEGQFGSAGPSTNSSGGAVVSFTIPSCYLGSKAIASAQVTSGGLYGVAHTSVAVNLLGYLPFLGPLAIPPDNVLLFALIMGAAIGAGAVLGGKPRRRSDPSLPPRPLGAGANSLSSPTPAASPTSPPGPAVPSTTGPLLPPPDGEAAPPPAGPPPSPPVGFSEENT